MDIRVNNYCEQEGLWGLIRHIAFISQTFETLAGRFRTAPEKLFLRARVSGQISVVHV
jgi:hypothetical protein